MKAALLVIVVAHGLLHVAGFLKAFHLAPLNQLALPVTKVNGMLWLAAAMLFIAAVLLRYLEHDYWWMAGVVAIVLSQYLILTAWDDAKYGTVANVVILFACVAAFGQWRFSRTYHHDVALARVQNISAQAGVLTERDMLHLPDLVKKYLRYTGAVGKPKVQAFTVAFTGQFRQHETSAWMPFHSEQHNFMSSPTRLFFMQATMKQVPVAGFHRFENGHASMDIRLLSLFRVEYQSGRQMDVSETVTFFNDMCVMAPATLIDGRIRWGKPEGNEVEATFTHGDVTVSAKLYFNDRGELINFISNDRYALRDDGTLQRTPWSTPLKEYREINGYRLGTRAETIYHYADGDFCYGKFNLMHAAYE
ncbi:MAG: hypothetical protein HC859_17575 [Bacteroidia bacterium]|nr:hypothetical protein [Bacteroidia bacterium]